VWPRNYWRPNGGREVKNDPLHILQLNEWIRSGCGIKDLFNPEEGVEPSGVSVLDHKRDIDDPGFQLILSKS